MITKRVFFSGAEVSEGLHVTAFFMMALSENGVDISRSSPHAVGFSPDTNAAQKFAETNANITTRPDMQWPEIPADQWQRAVDICNGLHTPEVKAAYEMWKQEQLAKMNIP